MVGHEEAAGSGDDATVLDPCTSVPVASARRRCARSLFARLADEEKPLPCPPPEHNQRCVEGRCVRRAVRGRPQARREGPRVREWRLPFTRETSLMFPIVFTTPLGL